MLHSSPDQVATMLVIHRRCAASINNDDTNDQGSWFYYFSRLFYWIYSDCDPLLALWSFLPSFSDFSPVYSFFFFAIFSLFYFISILLYTLSSFSSFYFFFLSLCLTIWRALSVPEIFFISSAFPWNCITNFTINKYVHCINILFSWPSWKISWVKRSYQHFHSY